MTYFFNECTDKESVDQRSSASERKRRRDYMRNIYLAYESSSVHARRAILQKSAIPNGSFYITF